MSPVVTSLLLALGLIATARAEVKDSSASGFTVENKRVVPVAPEAAFKVLVDDVDRWWPKDHSWWGTEAKFSIDPRAGGCFFERGGAREAMHMLVTFVDPPRLIRLTGGLGPLQGMGFQGALEVRLAPQDGGGTEITLWYRAGGYTPDDISGLVKVVDQVQALQLGGLATLLGATDKEAK